MHPQKVRISGISTEKLPVLTEQQNQVYLKAWSNGDKGARNALIQGNLRLVLSVAGRFAGRGEQADDLFQIGCIGLIKAIDNFDTGFDVRFSTYAVPMIIGEIRRYLRDNTAIRVSRSLKDLAYRAMKEREEYMNRYGCEPSCDTLAAVLQVPAGQLYRAIECTYELVSLSEPVYGEEGEDLHLGDRISDCESETDWLCTMLLKSAVQNLPTREKQILQLRFMVGHTQTEVAKEIGISQAQVSRLEKGALQQIRREIAL